MDEIQERGCLGLSIKRKSKRAAVSDVTGDTLEPAAESVERDVGSEGGKDTVGGEGGEVMGTQDQDRTMLAGGSREREPSECPVS